MENTTSPNTPRPCEAPTRELAAELVRSFTAVDDILQAQYAECCWRTPDCVAEELESRVAARLEKMAPGDRADIAAAVATLARSAELLGGRDPLDPWDVLAFRAPVSVRSHRVVLTDPPELSPEVRAVQAKLLRRGVVVLGEHARHGERTVEVSSYVEEWASRAVAELLPGFEAEWLARTAREIKPVPSAGWREKGDALIRVWVWVEAGEHIDEIVAAEDDEQVAVLAFACTPAAGSVGEPHHEPVAIDLERPIGDRVVVDGFSGGVVPHESAVRV